MRKTEILVSYGCKKQIAEHIGCSINTITGALSGLRNSKLVDKIRAVAIKKFGGVEIK